VSILKKKVIGVDIGSDSVKVVGSAGSGKGWKFGIASLPDGVVSGSQIQSAKLMASAVKRAMASAHIRNGQAVLCMTGGDVIIRHTVMPKMAPDQLRQNVVDEIAGYLSVNPAQYNVDYKIQEVIHDGGATQYRIMIAAVPRNIVDQYTGALTGAGLKVVRVDVAANAKEKLIKMLGEKGGNYAVVDMGMNTSSPVNRNKPSAPRTSYCSKRRKSSHTSSSTVFSGCNDDWCWS
jgi:type IV pilus assembly protein PilM